MSTTRKNVARVSLALMLAGCSAAGSAPTQGDVDAKAIGHQEGVATAPIRVVYFDDYVCDDCARFNKDAIEPLRRDWVGKGRAKLVVVDLAWKRGSVAGAAAAWCADEQGQYWPMHTMLFDRQEVWKRAVDIPAALASYAAELKLDTAKYNRCAASTSHRQRLDVAEEQTRHFAVRGTPAFVVNGKLFYGSQQWPWFEKVLLAYESGHPEAAPPPPLKIPTKSVVDSEKLKRLQDSIARITAKSGGPQ
ncbi:MAG: thioredoxin domain-containing protein [Gemmatimonadota bacterium]|nr:thioredoxin domain-containing protein [Gemmatimonadota bacterium]